MKTLTFRNALLALVALSSLAIYILACTSFSPDDTKVLYPAFDGTNRVVGVAVFDRQTRRSEMLLVPMMVTPAGNSNSVEPTLLRPQWLADGRRVLVAWPAGEANSRGLNVAVTSLDRRTPLRLFALPSVDEAGAKLVMPLGLIGDRLFVMESDQTVLRLDLTTGEVIRRALVATNQQVALYAAPDGKSLFFFEEQHNQGSVFGRLDPETLQCQSVFTFTNEPVDGSFLAFDHTGPRLAIVEKQGSLRQLLVLHAGQPSFTRPLPAGEELSFGSAVFGRRGDLIVASYRREFNAQHRSEFGLMEIPLSQAPLRETALVPSALSEDSFDALTFQVSLSHDGKTAAIASTYLACGGKGLQAKEVGLFLIDLSSATRKVTKVPALLPTGRSSRRN